MSGRGASARLLTFSFPFFLLKFKGVGARRSGALQPASGAATTGGLGWQLEVCLGAPQHVGCGSC